MLLTVIPINVWCSADMIRLTANPPFLLSSLLFPDTVCSDHGQCIYRDPSGNFVDSCTMTDICSALCECKTGYGGRDCSLSAAVLLSKDALRYPILSYPIPSHTTPSHTISYYLPFCIIINNILNFLPLHFFSPSFHSPPYPSPPLHL